MKKYAIIDVETTGGSAIKNKIIEIAIAIYDGKKVLETYETLIDPECPIPSNITALTGITQEMVANAPKFYEVAKKIVEITEKTIVVAHNAGFDYAFIKEEFRRLGYTYSRRHLCTVRLSRKTFPDLRSHSLSNLIQHFDLPCSNRHRAMGDVEATTILFEKILAQESSVAEIDEIVNLGVKESKLPQNISLEQLHDLPEECGVYYFHDASGEVVYVGKSINIKKRVMGHFSKVTEKARKLQQYVNDISYEITGSELVALLFESYEIKRILPLINRAQRRQYFPYVLHEYTDKEGYVCLEISKPTNKVREGLKVIAEYPKIASARSYMMRAVELFSLCPFHCNLERGNQPCFSYHLKKCMGACIQKETAAAYNERVLQAIDYLATVFEEDFFIIDQGRSETERAVVLVEQGNYKGYGYINSEEMNELESLRNAIKPVQGNPEVAKIIRSFLAGKHKATILRMS